MNTFLIAALVCALIFIILLILVIRGKKSYNGMPVIVTILCVLGMVITGPCAALLGFASSYYHAMPSAAESLETGGSVTVTQVGTEKITQMKSVKISQYGGCYFFDGSGTRDALIFYPGAKVEYTAYAPLMRRIAEQGVDCFVVEMPLNISLLNIWRADGIMSSDEFSYEHYYLAGHSMGGVAAATYCAKYPDNADGLILLASYPSSTLDSKTAVLSIYGDRDCVLDTEDSEAGKKNVTGTFEEHCIAGANHAQFGDYGAQKGDNHAFITPDRQIDETARLIKDFILNRS